MNKKLLITVSCGQILMGSLFAERTPWTHLNYQNNPDEFQFAIVPDRAGWSKDGRGAFTNALNKVNLLRPEFVMCVGDLIQSSWVPAERIRPQQNELTNMLSKVIAPFFVVVGNHDITSTHPTRPNGNEISTAVWKEYFGDNTYYSFVYKNVLFVVLNIMEGRFGSPKTQVGITPTQYAWFRETLAKHADVRWTFIFMHSPSVWNEQEWMKLEDNELKDRRYSVFAGDWHEYLHAKRNGHDYYALSVAGGVANCNWLENTLTGNRVLDQNALKGPEYGEMDHLTWVTMAKEGPVVANILLSGILPGDYLNQATTKAFSTTKPVDRPTNPAALKRIEENKKIQAAMRKSAKSK